MRGYLIIDGNSIGFAAHNTTKLVSGGQEVQAVFGVLRTIRQLYARYAHLQPIVLWDGGDNWRKAVYPTYKAHRDANPKQAKVREAYRKQRPLIARMLKTLGVWQMAAANMEADDLAGIMVQRAKRDGRKVILISGDQDWLQLVHEDCTWFDPIRDDTVTLRNFEKFTNPGDAEEIAAGKTFGYKTPRAFLEGKALQGDSGDLGPGSGVGGIGKKGASKLLAQFGSVSNFFEVMNREETPPIVPKAWSDFGLDPVKVDIFHRNMGLMQLPSPTAPLPVRMTLNKGNLDLEAFTDFCAEFAFNSVLKDLATFIQPFQPLQEAA
jgi:DNA polymerase-1